MRNFTLTVLTFITLSLPATVSSQMTLNWSKAFAAPSASNAHIATDGAGNIYVAGNSAQSYTLIKYNASGTGQWSTTGASGYNGVVGVGTDNAGNVYVVSSNGISILATAYGPSATQLWSSTVQIDSDDERAPTAWAMTVDGAGNVYIGGNITVGLNLPQNLGHPAYMTVRISGGVQKYLSTYQGLDGQFKQYANITGIACDNSGNAYVTGTTIEPHTYITRGIGRVGVIAPPIIRHDTSYDMTTIKFDSLGNTVWTNSYNGGFGIYDYGYAITVDPASGNIYALGQSSGSDVWGDVVAYSSTGSQLWAYQNTAFPNDDAIAVDASGNIITSGTNRFNVSKYSSTGSLTWSYSNAGIILSGNQYLGNLSMALDKSGNVYITSPANNFTEYYTAEITSGGAFSWSTTVSSGTNSGSSGIAVYTPIPRFGLINYPQITVTGSAANQTDFTTVQYSYHPIAVLTGNADSLTGLDNALTMTATEHLSNYPNPFRASTTISYSLAYDSHVILQVYDQSGKQIATAFEGDQNAGPHTQPFKANHLAAGVYFYRILANSTQGTHAETNTMAILP